MKVIDRNSQNVCKKLTCALQEKCVSYNDSDPWEKHFFILNKSQKKLKVLISNTSWILNPNEVISVHKFCLFSPTIEYPQNHQCPENYHIDIDIMLKGLSH